MNKEEVSKRVLKDGKPLPIDKFTWDEDTNTFSSIEDNLVLDFNEINSCTFNVGAYCTFNTAYNCTFKTAYNCTFNTGSKCTFDTGSDCTFKTEDTCTFNTRSKCTFDTLSDCTFKTGSDCTFDTGSSCTFDTGQKCVVVRRKCAGTAWLIDVYEVIELDEEKVIKLNGHEAKGYTVIEGCEKCRECHQVLKEKK